MHGSTKLAKELYHTGKVDPHSVETSSARTALHKAAYWDHINMVEFLLKECKVNPNARDYSGDSALHDAARFGHLKVIHALLNAVRIFLP